MSPTGGLFPNSAAFADEFTELFEYVIAVEQFSSCSLFGAALQFSLQLLKRLFPILLLTFQKPQRFPDYFTGSLIPARFHPFLQERTEFRGQ